MSETEWQSSAPVIGIVGWKNSGKTELVARLVAHFAGLGKRVACIKHAHEGFQIDHEGTDSFRIQQAGAGQMMLVSDKRMAMMVESEQDSPYDLPAALRQIGACDLILVEGFKSSSHRKLEIRRKMSANAQPLVGQIPNICAIISDDMTTSTQLPLFHCDAIEEIANFIDALVNEEYQKS